MRIKTSSRWLSSLYDSVYIDVSKKVLRNAKKTFMWSPFSFHNILESWFSRYLCPAEIYKLQVIQLFYFAVSTLGLHKLGNNRSFYSVIGFQRCIFFYWPSSLFGPPCHSCYYRISARWHHLTATTRMHFGAILDRNVMWIRVTHERFFTKEKILNTEAWLKALILVHSKHSGVMRHMSCYYVFCCWYCCIHCVIQSCSCLVNSLVCNQNFNKEDLLNFKCHVLTQMYFIFE